MKKLLLKAAMKHLARRMGARHPQAPYGRPYAPRRSHKTQDAYRQGYLDAQRHGPYGQPYDAPYAPRPTGGLAGLLKAYLRRRLY